MGFFGFMGLTILTVIHQIYLIIGLNIIKDYYE